MKLNEALDLERESAECIRSIELILFVHCRIKCSRSLCEVTTKRTNIKWSRWFRTRAECTVSIELVLFVWAALVRRVCVVAWICRIFKCSRSLKKSFKTRRNRSELNREIHCARTWLWNGTHPHPRRAEGWNLCERNKRAISWTVHRPSSEAAETSVWQQAEQKRALRGQLLSRLRR